VALVSLQQVLVRIEILLRFTFDVGYSIHVYACNKSMDKKCFYNSDGDMLFVLQEGRLDVQTEFGLMRVSPKEILVIPQGLRFSVSLPDSAARGYILEVFHNHFKLPELGPIGTQSFCL
jgi:homogentisate 1,2-dioxygenase